MTSTAIKIEGLWKEYALGVENSGPQNFREMLMGVLSSPYQRFKKLSGGAGDRERFWALKDIDLEIASGDVIGIIGRNGAGKSTLLKVLSRITSPTKGRIEFHGRLASLLEVGTGFHPELTGRENIYLNGAILGMTRRDILRKFDEIVAFAEVERFLDTPVKRYSSGMYVRLAFAVAAHLEPEILIIDEVLAVGDTVFQKKCLGKMNAVAEEGRTVLFVSHNMAAIKRLCHKVVWLSEGEVADIGDTGTIISEYLESGQTGDAVVNLAKDREPDRTGLQFTVLELLNEDGKPSNTMCFDEDVRIRVEVRAFQEIDIARIGIGLSAEGVRIATTHTPAVRVPTSPDKFFCTCRIPANTLLPNFYSITVGAHSVETGRVLDLVHDAVGLTVSPVSKYGTKNFDEKNTGFVNLNAEWNIGKFQ